MLRKMEELKISKKTGNENFSLNNGLINNTLINFWQWSGSDLISNSYRGLLAEYLVALDLGVTDKIRMEWAPFDLQYEGLCIEVKSSAYIQSWKQSELSGISFSIKPSFVWEKQNNKYSVNKTRPSHFYVFCLLNHKDQETIDPMNLDQWEFYLIPTYLLTKRVGSQKTISLNSLKKLNVVQSKFGNIKNNISDLFEKYRFEILSNYDQRILEINHE